jgi:drug/metabolite transporter (DMT)-like permease
MVKVALMNRTHARSNLLLLLTAFIWGLAFVAQRAGMEHIGPFAFNGIRFALGGASLFPLIIYFRKKNPGANRNQPLLTSGLLAGFVLFMGATLQQVGIVYTTAGKAGFITGFYVVLVPVLGIFMSQKTSFQSWTGAVLALIGLYLLGISGGDVAIQKGDVLELASAFFWAIHVQLIGKLSKKCDTIQLSCVQFFVCSISSLVAALFLEHTTAASVSGALIPILYGGLLSVGIAYTLQVVAQRHALPSHAAIIMSLESVFAALGGWMILSESMTARNITGCAIMFAGMVLSQIKFSAKDSVK